jgi:serine/threonine protein kinase
MPLVLLVDRSQAASAAVLLRLDSGRHTQLPAGCWMALQHCSASTLPHPPAAVLFLHLGPPQVGDFGLARVLDPGQNKLLTRSCGTMAYMPLELIQDNLLTKAADIYSFGVLCWEMLSGQRAWAGRRPVQILHARTALKLQLKVGEGIRCPARFKASPCPLPFNSLSGAGLAAADCSQQPATDQRLVPGS